MSQHQIIDDPLPEATPGSRIGWFSAGAVTVVLALALFYFGSGFLSAAQSPSVTPPTPPVIIEGN